MQTNEAHTQTGVAVRADSISFSYDDRLALDGLSLIVPVGSLFGLLGPNGSGKSTLLSLVAGLRAPAAGTVTAFGEPPSPVVRRRIGVLFQEATLDPLMTLGESLQLHARLYGMSDRRSDRRIAEVLHTIGLIGRETELTRTLSGGMRRRLELGRALLPSPDLLLLDEPTSGLDPESHHALWAHLLDINRGGATILVATNNVGEAGDYCDAVAFIHKGRVVAQGSPAELKAGLKRDGVWIEGAFSDDLINNVAAWPEVGKLTWKPPVLHATVDSAAVFVPRLFQLAGEQITAVRLREATLEDAYFDLVGASVCLEDMTR